VRQNLSVGIICHKGIQKCALTGRGQAAEEDCGEVGEERKMGYTKASSPFVNCLGTPIPRGKGGVGLLKAWGRKKRKIHVEGKPNVALVTSCLQHFPTYGKG